MDPVQLALQLKKIKEQNIDHVILEASSHGLKQNRLDGLKFKIKIFKIICQKNGLTSITLLSDRNSWRYFLISHQFVESGVPKLISKIPVFP